MNYKPGEVVIVPFPFIEKPVQKVRPALVLSNNPNGENDNHLVLVMITSAKRSRWESDVILRDWQSAGLRAESIVRWKIFTIEAELILEKRGSLNANDIKAVRNEFNQIFNFLSI
ncbi:MAG: type II toxin-antitoxin system PemK/MazF family toxin [Spirochaetota bacterium]|nr:type II toxin-antitoxin system PemK/MazF family toxin [Spirochaetota bacterium]